MIYTLIYLLTASSGAVYLQGDFSNYSQCEMYKTESYRAAEKAAEYGNLTEHKIIKDCLPNKELDNKWKNTGK